MLAVAVFFGALQPFQEIGWRSSSLQLLAWSEVISTFYKLGIIPRPLNTLTLGRSRHAYLQYVVSYLA